METTAKSVNQKGLIGTYAYLLTASALNMTSGILAYIMLTYSEISTTNVALLLTIPAIVGTLFAFVSGNLVNRFGAKKVTLFAHFTELLSGLIFLFFGNKTSIFVLYFASGLYGFNLGGQTVIQAQLFKEIVPNPDQRGAYLGYGTSIRSVGGVILATLGGIIAAVGNGTHWERAFLLYLIMIPALVLEALFLPNDAPIKGEINVSTTEKKAAEDVTQNPLDEKLHPKVWLISIHYLFFFLFLYAFSLNISEYVITTYRLGTSAQSGFCLSIMTVGGIFSGLFYGWYEGLLKKWTVPVLMVIVSVGLALIVFVPNLISLYIASFLLGVAMMGTSPYVIVEIGKYTGQKTYTKAMSIYSGFMNAGMMVAVYIFAFLAKLFFQDAGSVTGKFLIAFIGALIVLITSIPLYAGKENKKALSSQQ